MSNEGKQCKDCGNLGEKVECGMCRGKQGWKCKADPNGQHVHPEMGACIDFVDKCEHKDNKILKIEGGKLVILCNDCNTNLQSDIKKWDNMSLLYHFSEDVCVSCEHVTDCWECEERVMPKPNFMKYYCKKGAYFCFGDDNKLDTISLTAIMELERRKKNGVGS